MAHETYRMVAAILSFSVSSMGPLSMLKFFLMVCDKVKGNFQLTLLVYFSIQLQTEVKNILSLKLNLCLTLYYTLPVATLGDYFEKLFKTNNTFFVWKIHFIAYLPNFVCCIQNNWDQAQQALRNLIVNLSSWSWQTCYDQCNRKTNLSIFSYLPLLFGVEFECVYIAIIHFLNKRRIIY